MDTANQKQNLPRGIRNNNPLNIRKSNNAWLGKVQGTDRAFETFDTMEHGIRAAFIILRTYIRKHGCRFVSDLISRFAPSSENNTAAYIERVLKISNTAPREPLYFERRLQMCTILYAMHVVECGKVYIPLSEFTRIYDKFFNS